MNERIRVPQVRVIGPDGKQLGIMPTRRALELAYQMGLDLVEVAPRANPPVAKIMDYGKFKYEEKKKQKEAKKRAAGDMKELSLRPNIDDHDLQVKLRKAREILEEGDKLKLRVFFRGREIVHKEKGAEVLEKIIRALEDISMVERPMTMEGRNMVTILRPARRAEPEGEQKGG